MENQNVLGIYEIKYTLLSPKGIFVMDSIASISTKSDTLEIKTIFIHTIHINHSHKYKKA